VRLSYDWVCRRVSHLLGKVTAEAEVSASYSVGRTTVNAGLTLSPTTNAPTRTIDQSLLLAKISTHSQPNRTGSLCISYSFSAVKCRRDAIEFMKKEAREKFKKRKCASDVHTGIELASVCAASICPVFPCRPHFLRSSAKKVFVRPWWSR
jgi:hypothetical protein